MLILVWRSVLNNFSSPYWGIPIKSPLISISKTGMVKLDSCSGNTWMVFVLSVTAALAIKPCQFIVFKRTYIIAPAICSPSNNAIPKIILSFLKLQPSAIWLLKDSKSIHFYHIFRVGDVLYFLQKQQF